MTTSNQTPCTHPLVVDEPSEEAFREAEFAITVKTRLQRRCLICGFCYDRTAVVGKLRNGIRMRWRITLKHNHDLED